MPSVGMVEGVITMAVCPLLVRIENRSLGSIACG